MEEVLQTHEFNDNYGLPTTDNLLEYDFTNHWYILTDSAIVNAFGELPQDSVLLKQLKYQLTNNIYRYIYRFKTGREDHDHMEYELACNQRFREVLLYALLQQYAYATTSSGDILQLQHGVDINTEKVIDKDILRNELIIATFAQEALLQNGMLESTFRTRFDYTLYRVGY